MTEYERVAAWLATDETGLPWWVKSACLSALALAAKEEGPKAEGDWVLVPREPTEAMKEAAAMLPGNNRRYQIGTYEAMLAAAPNSPEAPE